MKKKLQKPRALVLFSGGLDSMLAVKILEEQGIEVVGLTFVSPFFGAETAEKSAKEIGIRLIVKDFSREHLKMMKNPKHGFGKNMNPCIDCHALMFRLAKAEMRKGEFDFLATGEVLGERPMSQNKQSLFIVEKEAGLAGKLLRPLSAKLLPETEIEKSGKVDREKLLDLTGRGRDRQLALAKKYHIKNFPTPSGGCKLTEKEFSLKLKTLLEINPGAGSEEIEILKIGRHIFNDGVHFVIGRDAGENLKLKELRNGKDLLVQSREVPGPSILVRSYGKAPSRKSLEEGIWEMLLKYNPKARKLEKITPEWL
ncbi:MAG: tRNA 4-thiouridine(8) synthase ThiI [Patescibacteria group bacterium]